MRLRDVEPGFASGNKKPGDQGRAVLMFFVVPIFG
jgi:hypothetical protein